MKPTATLLLSAMLLAACSHNNSETATDSPWELVWEENFDSDSIDSDVWSKIPRGTADWQNYMSDADTLYDVADGCLVLRGLEADNSMKATGDTATYLTGGVYTKGKKAFGYGRIEITARLHGAKGAWPAIWLLPDPAFNDPGSCQWPNGGEIDIMERLNHDTIAYQTVHSYYTLDFGHGLDSIPPHFSTGAIDPEAFNTYAVELYPDSLSFYINDIHTFTYPRIETELDGQFPFDKQFYLLIDMQLGGSWVGPVDAGELPALMEIDRVRYYRQRQAPTK